MTSFRQLVLALSFLVMCGCTYTQVDDDLLLPPPPGALDPSILDTPSTWCKFAKVDDVVGSLCKPHTTKFVNFAQLRGDCAQPRVAGCVYSEGNIAQIFIVAETYFTDWAYIADKLIHIYAHEMLHITLQCTAGDGDSTHSSPLWLEPLTRTILEADRLSKEAQCGEM